MYKSYSHKGTRVMGTRVVVLVRNIQLVDSSQERGSGEVRADNLSKVRRLSKCSDRPSLAVHSSNPGWLH